MEFNTFVLITCMLCIVFQQEDCNRDIGWYKSLKDTQGSVEVTSYGQMRSILRYGIYQVGVASQSRLLQNIHDVIFVKLNPGDKPLTKTLYSLDELRDLESKLVLITGSKAPIRTEVDHYSNVCAHDLIYQYYF